MNTDNPTLDLLVEKITGDPAAGLDGLDPSAIDALARDAGAASGEALAEELELAAAAAMLTALPAAAMQPMPQGLRDKILADAPGAMRPSASVTDLSSRRQPASVGFPGLRIPPARQRRWWASPSYRHLPPIRPKGAKFCCLGPLGLVTIKKGQNPLVFCRGSKRAKFFAFGC